jgi:hypothetical protein
MQTVAAMPTATLNDAFVEAIGCGHRRYMDLHPAAPVGFCLRTYRSGQKSFALRYRDQQRALRQIVIGSPPVWSVAAARAKATALCVQIDGGRDPLEERQALRQRARALTLAFIRDRQGRKRRAKLRRARRVRMWDRLDEQRRQQSEATA